MTSDANRDVNERTPLVPSACGPKSKFQMSRTKSDIVGTAMVVTGGLVFTVANVIQKNVPNINVWHLLFVRAVIQIVLISAYELVIRSPCRQRRHRNELDSPPSPSWWSYSSLLRLLSQAGISTGLLLCIFYAINTIPLGNASAIFFCTPVFTFILGACMLAEPMGIYRACISITMMSGVLLITRPPFLFPRDDGHGQENDFIWSGYLAAILVPILSAITCILTRQLKILPASLLLMTFATTALIASTAAMVATHTLSSLTVYTWQEFISLIAVAMAGITGNILYTVAMKFVSPCKANVFRSFEVVVNYTLQIYLEGVAFHAVAPVGIICLMLAMLAISLESTLIDRLRSRIPYM